MRCGITFLYRVYIPPLVVAMRCHAMLCFFCLLIYQPFFPLYYQIKPLYLRSYLYERHIMPRRKSTIYNVGWRGAPTYFIFLVAGVQPLKFLLFSPAVCSSFSPIHFADCWFFASHRGLFLPFFFCVAEYWPRLGRGCSDGTHSNYVFNHWDTILVWLEETL